MRWNAARAWTTRAATPTFFVSSWLCISGFSRGEILVTWALSQLVKPRRVYASLRFITCNGQALRKRRRKKSRPCSASLRCCTSHGAGTQHSIHFSCVPARGHTITTNSKASVTKQTTQQPKPPRHRYKKQNEWFHYVRTTLPSKDHVVLNYVRASRLRQR